MLVLAVMVAFVAIEQCFISTVTWLLLSEQFPMKIRGFAMGIAVFALWMVNFGISQVFPSLSRAAGSTVMFLIFVGPGHPLPGVRGQIRARDLEDLEAGSANGTRIRPRVPRGLRGPVLAGSSGGSDPPARRAAGVAFPGTRPAFSVQLIPEPVKVGEEFGFQVQARSARYRLELFDPQEIG